MIFPGSFVPSPVFVGCREFKVDSNSVRIDVCWPELDGKEVPDGAGAVLFILESGWGLSRPTGTPS